MAASAAVVTVLALSGCAADASEQWQRVGLPEGATEEAPLIGDLWVGAWVTAFAVGILVWGLILWAVVAYRKRSDDLPPQTRFNMPIEFLYTVTPLIVIGVLFYFTVQHQDDILDESEPADLNVEVIGQQWSWTFNYVEADVHDVGTQEDIPTLYLPVDQTVRFELNSADVVHSFWVPQFYMKMDVVPGRTNSFQVTPNQEGTFAGKCAELCGAYHSRMLFNVEVLPENEYEARMDELRQAGQGGQIEIPLRGTYENETQGSAGGEQ